MKIMKIFQKYRILKETLFQWLSPKNKRRLMGSYFRRWYPFEYAEDDVFIWGDDRGESVLTDNRRRLFITSQFNVETSKEELTLNSVN